MVFKGESKSLINFIRSPFKLSDLIEGAKSMKTLHKNQNLLALNINSYMAGAVDIWRKAKPSHMIKRAEGELAERSHSDGKIELVSFSSSNTMGM